MKLIKRVITLIVITVMRHGVGHMQINICEGAKRLKQNCTKG